VSNSIYGIGLSGLAAAQAGLATAGHNIANVNTPGFSRQEVLLATRTAMFSGSGFIGQGVDVDTVRRVYDRFLAVQAWRSQSEASQLDAYATALAGLDRLLGEPAHGLAPAMDEFFAGVNAVAAHPSDVPARQALLATAGSLASRFGQLAEELESMRTAANARVAGSVASINGIAGQIADTNRRIAEARAHGESAPAPNDLMDERDALVTRLNELTGARVVTQEDGSYNVFLANGQALVVGQQAYRLAAVPDPLDPRNLQIGIASGTSVVGFRASELAGGELGGVLAYRDTALASAQNALGRIALVLGEAFNAQHRLGVDLRGQPGSAFFRVGAPSVQNALGNVGNATLATAITDPSALTTSDYRLSFDGSQYTLTRLADNVQQSFATLPATIDGFAVALASGAPAAGDGFLVQPTRYAARDLAVALSDPARIAAAAPIRTAAILANAGNATISAGSIDASYLAAPLGAPVTLAYAGGTGMLTGFPATSGVSVTVGATTTTYAPGLPVPYTPGATYAFGGIRFTLDGAPADGDRFTIEPNVGGAGDNRNARALAALAGRGLLDGGTATLASAYGELVTTIGADAQAAGLEHATQAGLLAQAREAQQSVSGVNLDEEAANLQRYQQAYQAAGRVIAIANSMFETVLDIARS
jgi:flagellar hook-associated protein 1 FlgK